MISRISKIIYLGLFCFNREIDFRPSLSLRYLKLFLESEKTLRKKLVEEIKKYLGYELPIQIENSGETALIRILEKMEKKSTQQYVIVSEYTCGSVYRAVNQAGFKALICPIDLNGNVSQEACIRLCENMGSQVLAVIDQNLFNYKAMLNWKLAIELQRRSINYIFDLAHCLSSEINHPNSKEDVDLWIYGSLGSTKPVPGRMGGFHSKLNTSRLIKYQAQSFDLKIRWKRSFIKNRFLSIKEVLRILISKTGFLNTKWYQQAILYRKKNRMFRRTYLIHTLLAFSKIEYLSDTRSKSFQFIKSKKTLLNLPFFIPNLPLTRSDPHVVLIATHDLEAKKSLEKNLRNNGIMAEQNYIRGDRRTNEIAFFPSDLAQNSIYSDFSLIIPLTQLNFIKAINRAEAH